jgi:CheY-like chemotaxis protein
VKVESVFGEGSRFIVTLPWAQQPAGMFSPAVEEGKRTQPDTGEDKGVKQLILIVDDNQFLLDMMANFLEGQNFRTIKIHSGRELLVRVPDLRPDLILMDVQMPGMDGMETIRRIRAERDSVIASTPIIAVTALVMTGDRECCLAAGANEYMSKSVKLKELASNIKKLILKVQ